MINFDPVAERLFVGTCPRSELDLRRLAGAGVTGVLNLQTDADFRRWGVDWEALQRGALALDIMLYRLPIIDFDPDDLRRRLPLAVETLGRLLGLGHRVYLHCTAGRERSPAVAVGHLAWNEGRGLERALEHVRACRRCNPNEEILRELDAGRSAVA